MTDIHPPRGSNTHLTNTTRLVLLMLRRERLETGISVLAMVVGSIALAAFMSTRFDPASRQALILTLNNPGIIAMMGPVYGLDDYTVGAMYANTVMLWMVMAAAVVNILLVIRLTLADEQKGLTEIIRSLPVGRLASLHAAMTVVLIVNVVVALAVGVGIYAVSDVSLDLASSLLYGAALGVCSLYFAALAAVCAQVASGSRSAIGISLAAMALLYLMRAVGDMGCEPLSRLSALGLVLRTQVFVNNQVWPLLLILLQALALAALAYLLNLQRDSGSGLLPARPGRSRASGWLQTPGGLALRLSKSTITAWAVAVFLLAASYGSALGSIDSFVAENAFYQQLVGLDAYGDDFTMTMIFATFVTAILNMLSLVPLLLVTLKTLFEEKDGRADPVMSTGVSRYRYMLSHTGLAFAASLVFPCLAALGLYATAAVVLPDADAAGIGLVFLSKANLVFLPAFWLMIGFATFVVGLFPKAVNAVWIYYSCIFFVTLAWDFVPEWMTRISPFAWLPKLPVDSLATVSDWLPMLVVTAIAAVLTAAGLVGYRRRDLA